MSCFLPKKEMEHGSGNVLRMFEICILTKKATVADILWPYSNHPHHLVYTDIVHPEYYPNLSVIPYLLSNPASSFCYLKYLNLMSVLVNTKIMLRCFLNFNPMLKDMKT